MLAKRFFFFIIIFFFPSSAGRYPVTNCGLLLRSFSVKGPQRSPPASPSPEQAAGAEPDDATVTGANRASKAAVGEASPAVLRSAATKAVRAALQGARDRGECFLVEPFMSMQVASILNSRLEIGIGISIS